MAGHFGVDQAKYMISYKSFLVRAADSDLAHDLQDRKSTTSNIITINHVVTHRKIDKQPEPTNSISKTKLMSLHSK
eukprot:2176545-Ditylum_brightwellii.AAC.1